MPKKTPWYRFLPLAGVIVGVVAGFVVPQLLEEPEEPPERVPVTAPCPTTPAGQTYPDATPYAGPGPHPITSRYVDRRPDQHPSVSYTATEHLPKLWTVNPTTEWEPRPQLVLCRYLDSVGAQVSTCNYRPEGGTSPTSSLTVVQARYTFALLEARTGKVLTTFQLDGKTDTCPDRQLRAVSGVSPLVPTESDLVNALRSFVEQPV